MYAASLEVYHGVAYALAERAQLLRLYRPDHTFLVCGPLRPSLYTVLMIGAARCIHI